jgi:hypothetical protein
MVRSNTAGRVPKQTNAETTGGLQSDRLNVAERSGIVASFIEQLGG